MLIGIKQACFGSHVIGSCLFDINLIGGDRDGYATRTATRLNWSNAHDLPRQIWTWALTPMHLLYLRCATQLLAFRSLRDLRTNVRRRKPVDQACFHRHTVPQKLERANDDTLPRQMSPKQFPILKLVPLMSISQPSSINPPLQVRPDSSSQVPGSVTRLK